MRVAFSPTLPTDGPFDRALSFGILSSYPPTACGLATFTTALPTGCRATGPRSASSGWPMGHRPRRRRVIGELRNGSPASVAASAELLNQCDVAVIQHEYGLFGGADGDEVLEVLANLRVPSIVIAHTILRDPTPHQRDVLVEAVALSDRVVVMSEAARLRLCTTFDVDPARVVTIAHGAADPSRGPGPPTPAAPAADHVDLGPHRSGQRHRTCPRCHAGPAAAAHARRATWWRAAPIPRCWRPTGSSTAKPVWRRRAGWAWRTRCASTTTTGTCTSLNALIAVERRCRAAVRLDGSGHLGRPGRCHRRGKAGRGDRLRPRRRTVGQRRRHRGPARRSRCHGVGTAPGADSNRGWPNAWRPKHRGSPRLWAGRSWPGSISDWPERRWLVARAPSSCDADGRHNPGTTPQLRPHRLHERSARHVRACRVRGAPTRARLLHRRHGPRPRGGGPRARGRSRASRAWSAWPCASWSTPRA